MRITNTQRIIHNNSKAPCKQRKTNKIIVFKYCIVGFDGIKREMVARATKLKRNDFGDKTHTKNVCVEPHTRLIKKTVLRNLARID